MIVVFGSQKGGVGKTTTSTNVCVELAKRGKDVLLVDADRQENSSQWVRDRGFLEGDYPRIHSAQKYGDTRESLLDYASRYEYVIVDSAGRDSEELRSSSLAADILILPFRPSQFDLNTLPELNESILKKCALYNPKMKCFAIFTMTPTNPKINEINESIEYFDDYSYIDLLKTNIADRKVFRDCCANGTGVVETSNSKAANDIKNLVDEILI